MISSINSMDSFIILSQCSFFTPPFWALFLRRSTQSVKPSWLAAILFLNSVITAGESIPFAPNTIRALVIAPQVPPHFIPPPKLQPIAAADVCRTGFGDCKGLSNYTRAMLKELGIASTYTIISTTNERLLPDFSSANQMNHVILQVPLPQDTLWLECTNPSLPFGYVHQDIAGHDALLIEPDGGKMCRLPTYPDSLNTQHIAADITLSPTAEARIEVNEVSRIFQYENEAGIVYLEPNKQKDRIRSGIHLSQADIRNLQISECKEANPSITFRYTATSNQYGHKTGNRLFIPANVFRKEFSVPPLTKRTYPIHIDYGYTDTDSIRIQLPEGYVIEGLPKPLDVKSKFGSFHSDIQVKDKKICIVHRLFMSKGVYSPDEYAAFLDFRKQVAGQYSGKIILKKE